MDARQFVDGYKEPANHIVAHHYEERNPEVQELMEGPRRWTSFFDRQLILFMKGERNGVNEPRALFNGLRTYQLDWIPPFLDATYKSSLELSKRESDAQPTLDELNFHLMSREMMPAWYNLFFADQAIELGPNQIHEMQVRLALLGTDLQDKWLEEGSADQSTGLRSGVQGWLGGQLTKIDSAITLLEVMKKEGNGLASTLITVPAPPRFKSAHRNQSRSVDFIVYDTLTKNMRGVHAQTNLAFNEGTATQTDSRYVTLIDGSTDLGNTGREYSPSNGHHVASKPGMLSLDYLVNRTSVRELSRNPRFNNDLNTLLRLRSVASKNFGARKTYIAQAAEHVGERLLRDLQQDTESS